MADNLSISWELRGTVEKQIKEALKDSLHLSDAFKQLDADLAKIGGDKMMKAIAQNVKDAEAALYKLMDAREKVEKALSRNMAMRTDGFIGIDESKLLQVSARLDEIIDRVMNIGVQAGFSKTAVKDLLNEMSSSIVLKEAKSSTSAANKGLDKQEKERIKEQKEAVKELGQAWKNADDAARNNAKNQELVRSALSKIAAARASLSAASEKGSQQEIIHAQWLMRMLDNITNKLTAMQGKFLGTKDALSGVLDTIYQRLMGNVSKTISDIGKVDSLVPRIQRPVDMLALRGGSLQRIQQIIEEMTGLQGRLKDLRAEQEKGIFRPKDVELVQQRYASLKAELDSLLSSMRKVGEMSGIYGGLGHLRGYTGPQSALSDEAWAAAKREAEVREVATAAAEKHRQKLNELQAAFDRQAKVEERASAAAKAEADAQERSQQKAHAQSQARRQSSQEIRKQAEELVRLRLELLKTQAAELSSMLKNGAGVLSTQQYQQLKEALRGVVREMTTLKNVMADMGNFSTRDLFGFGRGSQNWSPLIQNAQQLIQTQQAVRQLSLEEEKLMQSIEKASNAFSSQNKTLGDLQSMTQNYLSLWGAKDFLNKIIEIGGQLEMQRLSIGAILGDTAHANDLFDRIKALAVQSPFGVVELDQYTKQLSAYGFKYDELYDMTKRLADISAGAGTDVSRLALALGHVRSEAALSGYTLRQFAMNNIPMVSELAKLLTETEGKIVSVADVRKRVKGKEIGYEEVETVIKRLTDEGGMFYNMQEVVSQSVKARFKNLRDALDIMYGEMAESNVGDSLKTVATVLTSLTRHWQEFLAVAKSGLVVLGAYKAVMLTTSVLLGKEAAAVEAGTIAKAKADKANLRMAMSYRSLTIAEQASLGTRGKALIMADALALSEKKLTAEGIARQVALGRLTKAEANQAIQLANLTAIEKVHIWNTVQAVRTYGALTPMVNGLSMGIARLGIVMKGLIWNPITAVFAAIGVATELWQRNNEETERARELNEDLFNRATEGIRNIKAMMGETGLSFTLNGKDVDFGNKELLKQGAKFEFTPAANMNSAEMITTMERWTQFIKDYSANANSILNEAFADKDGKVRKLAEQYELLGKAVGETAEAYVWLKDASEAAEFAESGTNKGWLDDSLITNINDYAEDVKAYNDAVSKSVMANRQFWSVVLKAARAHAGFSGTLKREGIDAENLSEQIKVLIEDQERYAGAIALADKAARDMGRTLSEFGRTNDSYLPGIGKDATIQDYYASMSDSRKTMEEDIDLQVERMKQGLQDLGWVLDDLSEGQKQAISLAIAEVVSKASKGTEDIRKKDSDLIKKKFKLTIDADTINAAINVATLKKSLEDLVGHDWTINIKSVSNFDDLISNIRKSYKSAEEFFNNAKPLAVKMGIDVSSGMRVLGISERDILLRKWKDANPGKDATMYEQFLEQWDNMAKSIQDAMDFSKATGISLTDPNKKNKGGGSKADAQLKRWKEEWGELKAFYSEFKKWAKEIGDDAALRKLRESGLWSQLFGADGKAKYDMTDWGKAIDEFKKRNGVNGSTTDRKKFVFELGKAKVDVEFDINKKVLERELSELQEYLSMQSERWNLFKSLFEKTGNRDFASLAFGDGQMWNDLSREFADELETMMTAAGKPLPTGVWSMTDAAAKEYFKEVSGGYETWKKTVDLIRGEYKDNLNAIADAYSKVATEETKVAAAEARLAEARKRYGNDSAQAILAEKALNTVRAEAFEKSDLYTRFYSALFTMTISEAERAGEAIKKNLAKQLSEGTINADKYLKSIKNIDAQLDKMRNKKSGYELFKSGGFAGAAEQNVAIAEDAVSAAAERAERAEQAVLEARLKAANAVTDAEREAARLAILRARVEKTLSEEELQQAESQLKSAKQGLQLSTKANNTMNAISMVLGTWANMYKDFVNYAAEMGEDVEIAEGWDGMFGMFGSISNGINKFMSGDIGGGLMETVFGSALSFSKDHDKRMARDQKRSEEIVNNLLAAMEIIEKSFERTLVSIYEYRATAEDLAELYHYIGRETPEEEARPTFGWGYKSKVRSDDTRAAIESALASGSYFDTELASLYVQRDELIRQMEDEQDKKDSDDDKVRDYKSQIAEIKDQIENFAEDMAKELWDIDVREWATQLGDALFEAWQQGESGAEAFKKKSSEIIAGLAKNIATQKLIEVAMKPVLDAVVSEMERTDGLLDVTSTEHIAAALATVGETLPTAFNTLMDGIEAGVQRSGLGSIKDTDGSSSGSSLIQGSFTENETSLIMAYLNGMRGDLSIQRSEVTAIRTLLQGQAGMPAIAQAQLQRLQIIAVNTGRNAGLVQDIYDLLRRLSPDGQRWKV